METLKELKVILSPEVVEYINMQHKVVMGTTGETYVWGKFAYRRNDTDDEYVYTHIEEVPQEILNKTIPVEVENMKLVGRITKPWGLKGFVRCEVGHKVYELADRYYLIMDSEDGKVIGHKVSFNKEELSKIMDKTSK